MEGAIVAMAAKMPDRTRSIKLPPSSEMLMVAKVGPKMILLGTKPLVMVTWKSSIASQSGSSLITMSTQSRKTGGAPAGSVKKGKPAAL